MRKVLSIAGSDCSGGAGIQADIKTIMAHQMYAMSVITSITAQNTLGVMGREDCNSTIVEQQLESVLSDIYPDAVKIGMVPNLSIAECIVDKLKEYEIKNIVIDPVMISSSGHHLIDFDVMEYVQGQLYPLATLITPNLSEAAFLSKHELNTKEDMIVVADILQQQFGCSILLKGGHLVHSADDLLYMKNQIIWVEGDRINSNDTHGTGCTMSSSIACYLAYGYNLIHSVQYAKEYITRAIKTGLHIGKGNGPLNHLVTTQFGNNKEKINN